MIAAPSPGLTAGIRVSVVLCALSLLALFLLARPGRAYIGGDDVRVRSLGLPSIFEEGDGTTVAGSSPAMVAHPDGRVYIAIQHEDADDGDEIRIYDSEYDEMSWGAGLTLYEYSQADHHISPAMTLAPVADEGILSVVYEFEPESGLKELRVSSLNPYSIPSDPWDTVTLATLGSGGYRPRPRVVSQDVGGGVVHVHAVWAQEIGANEELRFARSTDAGVTFAASLTLDSIPASHKIFCDMAIDLNQILHLAWVDVDPATNLGTLYFQQATQGGSILPFWGTPQVLDNLALANDHTRVTVMGQPDGPEILVAAREELTDGESRVLIYFSNDNGVTWSPPQLLDGFEAPDLGWGSAGPGLGIRGADGYYLAVPDGTPDGNWSADLMIQMGDDPIGAPAVLPQENESGRFMMAAVQSVSTGLEPEPWFDAEWRDEPGHGVCETGRPVVLPAAINSAPAVADLDGDGGKEIIATLTSGTVMAYDLLARSVSLLIPIGGTSVATAVSVPDLEGDGTREIFVGNDTGEVHRIEHDGSISDPWPVDLGTGAPAYVACGNLSNFARLHVVAASGNGIWALNGFGTVKEGFPFIAPPAHGNVVGRPALGDVDGDGEGEIVAAFQGGLVIIGNGGVLENVLYSGPGGISAPASLCDLDDDGDLEITISRGDGYLDLVHHTGVSFDPFWPYDLLATGNPVGPVSLANFRGDVTRELLVTAQGFGLKFGADGALLGSSSRNLGTLVGGTAIVNNIAGDYVSAIAGYGSSPFGWRGNFDEWYLQDDSGPDSFPRDAWADVYVTPASGDLDDDGNVELVLPAGRLLWILDMGVPQAPVGKRWPMDGYNARRSSCAGCELPDPTAADPERPLGVTAGSLVSFNGIWPNPASGPTTFAYELGTATRVELRVYDVRGRLVDEIVGDAQGAGSHIVSWSGRDAEGRPVASGTYFARLRVAGPEGRQVTTRKFGLVR